MQKLLATLAILAMGFTLPALAEHEGDGTYCKMNKKDHFTQADSNKDGAIDKTEAQAMHDKHFEQMDKNHDGKLSENESAACKRDQKR